MLFLLQLRQIFTVFNWKWCIVIWQVEEAYQKFEESEEHIKAKKPSKKSFDLATGCFVSCMLFHQVVHKLFICRSCWIEAPFPWMKPAGCEREARCINKRQASSLSMAAVFSSNTLQLAVGHV